MAPSLGVVDACGVGTEHGPYLKPKQWAAGVSYRYLNSFRDFHGSDELPLSSPLYYPGPGSPLLYADTYVNTWDVSLTYAATERLNVTLDIPFLYGSRTSYYEHDFLSLYTMRASGLGDLRLSASFWLLEPNKHPNENISLGLGVKFPTGDDNAADYSHRATGLVLRPVDAAIQLGDGGWGVLFGIQGFAKVFPKGFVYLQGSYLMSPREIGTPTPFADVPDFTFGIFGYMFNSVPDQYLARGGLTYGIWPKMGLSLSLGARIEGVPVHDLVGGSDGYRIPGYAISIEPGVSVTRDKWTFSVTVPVAVERHADKDVVSEQFSKSSGVDFGGYGAFADFLVTASVSYRF